MKDSQKRNFHYARYGAPTPDDPEYDSTMKRIQNRLDSDPKFRKKMEEGKKKATSIVCTQGNNGLGFIQDEEIRYFQREYNARLWDHGLSSMPSSFRVLEGFYKWREDLFMFEIFQEEEHLFSFFDFLDFVTSDKCSTSVDYFIENVQDDLIYSYNILNEVDEITFKTIDSQLYVIGGVSIIKRGNEAYVLLIAGEKGDIDSKTQKLREQAITQFSKSYLKFDKSSKPEAVKLFNKDDIWKVNLYIRVDLATKTVDVRYVQKDAGNSLTTITDDIGMLVSSFAKEYDLEEYMRNHILQVENYQPIFEVAYKCLHLPEYFNFFEDSIQHEEHPTKLFTETLRKSALGKIPYDHSYFLKTRDVWVLDNKVSGLSPDLVLRTTELQIQRDGYWEQLAPGEIGRGKNGEPIHNRTWVEKTLTWYQGSNPKDVFVDVSKPISQNAGYIYIMRNPAHALDIFKIGLTTKTADERAAQLSASTGSPDKFLIIQRWKVNDCFLAEKLIHQLLDNFRLNPKREFFRLELDKALPLISDTIEQLKDT